MTTSRGACALLLALVLLAGGCGASSAPIATTPLEDASVIGPRQFLADAAAAAAAVRDFAAVLDGSQDLTTPARLSLLADALEDPTVRARLMAQRLAAARLADRRLEEERRRVAPALGAVVSAMDEVLRASRAGNGAAAAAASARLAEAARVLREVGSSGAG